MTTVVAIVPKFAITGGNLEVNRLMRDLQHQGCSVSLVSLYPKSTRPHVALLAAPFFTVYAIIKILSRKPDMLIVTHYTTLPYSLLAFACRLKSIAFIQDFEWLFVSQIPAVQRLSKAYHLFLYNFVDCFVFGNRYLESGFPSSAKHSRLFRGVPHQILYPVGSVSGFEESTQPRHGIGFILRNGWLKNQSMYYEVFSKLIASNAIDPGAVCGIDMLNSASSSDKFSALGIHLHSPMHADEVSSWMARHSIFLCLSIHEGFGLPPLEAMCQGTIPLVLMNGGCTAYMGPFSEFLMAPHSSPEQVANKIAFVLSWQDTQLSSYRRRVKEHAIQYLSWAQQTRNTASAAIASL